MKPPTNGAPSRICQSSYQSLGPQEEEPQGKVNTGKMGKELEMETTENEDAEYQIIKAPTIGPRSLQRQRQGSEKECQK